MLRTCSLVRFLISDPPHMQKAKQEAERNPIDFVGLVLAATGLGALQVVLDKRQHGDWFASNFISWFTDASLAALIAFVVWEWRQKHPIVHLHCSSTVASPWLAHGYSRPFPLSSARPC